MRGMSVRMIKGSGAKQALTERRGSNATDKYIVAGRNGGGPGSIIVMGGQEIKTAS